MVVQEPITGSGDADDSKEIVKTDLKPLSFESILLTQT